MDAVTFGKFIEHVDRHAGTERPILLIIDSVASHVDITAFSSASERGIEVYRLVPNATHLMQPLDKGVFGALKTKWYQVTRQHTREHPGSKIGKPNFAEKLAEAFNEFYRPSTIVNSFRATGVYPIDRGQITAEMLAPGKTYTTDQLANWRRAMLRLAVHLDMTLLRNCLRKPVSPIFLWWLTRHVCRSWLT